MRPLGVPSHPLTDLHRLAARLGRAAPTSAPTAPGLPGPQALADLGERLGLEFVLGSRDIATLTAADCPCVVLLSDGSSRLVIEAHDNGALVLAGDGESSLRVDRRALGSAATGGILTARVIDRERPAPLSSSEAGTRRDHAPTPAMATSAGNPLAGLLLRTAYEKRPLVIALAVAGLLSGLINLAVPIFTMVVFDRVIPHSAFETLWALLIGVSLLLILDFGLRHVKHTLHDAVSVSAMTGLGARLFSRLTTMPVNAVPRQPAVLVQPYQELNQATQLAPQFIAGVMVDVPFFLCVVLLMSALGGWLALIPVIGAGLLALSSWIGHRLSVPPLSEEHRLNQRQTQMIIDATQAAESIRLTGVQPLLLKTWEDRADQCAMAGHRFRSLMTLSNHAGAVILQAVTIATVAIGAYAVSASLMTVGALSACMMLASRAIMPIATLLTQGFRLQQLATSTSGIGHIIAADPEHGTDSSRMGRQSAITGHLALSGVSFTHAESPTKALQAITLSIKAGERVALIGKSGSGKSTLLKLLTRLYEPTDGVFHVDGRDARQIDPQSLRQAFALMPQEPHLFDSTLEANMTLGLSQPETEWMRRVADITGVADLAARQPQGFSLPVGPGGSRLSGGERQAVALARALMGKPRLLLLDEPTAAMDTERETRLIKALSHELRDGMLQGTGLIIATHRLPILALVDRIIWLDHGRVKQDGAKEQLLATLSGKAA